MSALNEIMIFMTLKDNLSTPIRGIGESLNLLREHMKAVSGDMRQMGEAMKAVGGSLMKSAIADLRTAEIAKNALMAPVNISMDFNQQMAMVGAIADTTAEDLQKLKDEAERLGLTTRYSASQAGGAMEQLARAGYKPAQILDVTNDVLKMAAIENMDLADAANVVVGVLGGFGLTHEMGAAAEAANMLAQASALGKTNIQELGYGMSYFAPVARDMGISMSESLAMMDVLSNAGIDGSRMGNTLRQMVNQLAKDSSQKILKEYGIQVADANGNMLNFQEILYNVNKATAHLGNMERKRIFSKLFQTRGELGANPLIRAVLDGELQEKIDKINEAGRTGYADRKYEQVTNTLQGAMWAYNSAYESLMIALGNTMENTRISLTLFTKDVLVALTEWVKRNPGVVKAITGIATALIGFVTVTAVLKFAFGAVLSSVGTFLTAASRIKRVSKGILDAVASYNMFREAGHSVADSLRNCARSGGLASKALNILLKPTTWLVLAFVALGGIIYYTISQWDNLSAEQKAFFVILSSVLALVLFAIAAYKVYTNWQFISAFATKIMAMNNLALFGAIGLVIGLVAFLVFCWDKLDTITKVLIVTTIILIGVWMVLNTVMSANPIIGIAKAIVSLIALIAGLISAWLGLKDVFSSGVDVPGGGGAPLGTSKAFKSGDFANMTYDELQLYKQQKEEAKNKENFAAHSDNYDQMFQDLQNKGMSFDINSAMPKDMSELMSNINDMDVFGFARGGYITKPTLGLIGEGRYNEWIIPEDGSAASRNMVASAAAANGISLGESRGQRPIVITAPIYISVPETENADKFVGKLAEGLRHYADTQGAYAY